MLITKNDKNEFEISNYDNVIKIVDCHMSLKKSINFFVNMREKYLSIHENFFCYNVVEQWQRYWTNFVWTYELKQYENDIWITKIVQ